MGEVILRPESIAEMVEAVRSAPRLRVLGSGSRLAWIKPWSGPTVSTLGLTGIVDMRATDGVVVVRAGTLTEDFLAEMEEVGLTLPLALGLPRDISQRFGTVGGLVATGLPHALEALSGPIRDWVLGVTVVRGDGSVCKAGSKVLKSVAGFDVQRFAVGSRGGLFALAEVVLRLRRVAAVPAFRVEMVGQARSHYVARVLPDHLGEVATLQRGLVAKEPSGLFWTSNPVVAELGSGWWIGPGGTRSRVQAPSLEFTAKETIDPDGRFEGGWADA